MITLELNMKTIKKIAFGILVVVAIIIGLSCYNKTNKIEQVKGGRFNDYPNTTVGEAFDQYMGDEEWTYIKENGIEKVKVTGNIMYLNEESKAEATFRLYDDGTFRMIELKIDDVSMGNFMRNAFVSDVYDEYNNNIN